MRPPPMPPPAMKQWMRPSATYFSNCAGLLELRRRRRRIAAVEAAEGHHRLTAGELAAGLVLRAGRGGHPRVAARVGLEQCPHRRTDLGPFSSPPVPLPPPWKPPSPPGKPPGSRPRPGRPCRETDPVPGTAPGRRGPCHQPRGRRGAHRWTARPYCPPRPHAGRAPGETAKATAGPAVTRELRCGVATVSRCRPRVRRGRRRGRARPRCGPPGRTARRAPPRGPPLRRGGRTAARGARTGRGSSAGPAVPAWRGSVTQAPPA